LDLLGQNYTDPSSSYAYRSFAGKPLFGDAGPVADDVAQGQVGDCYYLASLAAFAKTNPNVIRQAVVDLGDGTYAVRFQSNGGTTFVRVDADLPTYGGGTTPAYAKFGKQGSMWVAVMEKAFAYVRTSTLSYASLDSGWMSEASNLLGLRGRSTYSASGGQSLLDLIATELNAGKAVTYAAGTVSGDAPLIGSHAYTVDSIQRDSNGVAVSMRLRNPWGFDGAGNDGNTGDGYVTVTGAQALACLLGFTSATV
jgi:hypothetical protein